MPNQTEHFKLDHFIRGSYYSSTSDYHRFVTLDYNTESYVGIVGVGIIDGWTLHELTGLNISIWPGSGIIDSYYSESPYTIKQRSDMVMGEHEIYEMPNPTSSPISYLTPAEKIVYVSIIQNYNPSYNPPANISNAYVKVVVPYVITVSDDSDTYIYAQRPSGALPYPLLSDYPVLPSRPPNREDYTTYDDYNNARLAYEAQLEVAHDYQWYTSDANHFTQVEFVKSSIYMNSNTKVLLGRVMARSGKIIKIDTKLVNTVKNLESAIREYAKTYIIGHQHGGSKNYDPPRIRLETDIRSGILFSLNTDSGRSIFNIVEKNESSISEGHKHSYRTDSNGYGVTLEQMGSLSSHMHEVSDFIVLSPSTTEEYVPEHIHTVNTSNVSGDTWTSSSRYIVYVNDEAYADETSSDVSVNVSTKQIVFNKNIGFTFNKYRGSLSVTLKNPTSGKEQSISYSYENYSASVYYFMLTMINDFCSQYSAYFEETIIGEVSNIGFISENINAHPFLFFDDDGNIIGITDLQNQSTAAQALMKYVGDNFLFTPDAAKNVRIELIEVGTGVDEVKIEILGNTEVTGILPVDNILFINANKIIYGELALRVIPFISHIGRYRESLLPYQYPLFSRDGVRYLVTPAITTVNYGHNHLLQVDESNSGITSDLYVGSEPSYYAMNNSNSYFIYHTHSIEDGNINNSESSGLLSWQNAVNSTNLSSSSHSHQIINFLRGNNKTIYAIKEDDEQNLYLGTSNGLVMIPYNLAYLFVINGVEIYGHGNNLWQIFQSAVAQYQTKTNNAFYLLESVYKPIMDNAQLSLTNEYDSIFINKITNPQNQIDKVMVMRVFDFLLPDFKYIRTKKESAVLDTEIILNNSNSNSVTVERNFNDTPIWSMALETETKVGTNASYYNIPTSDLYIMAIGSNLIAKNIGLNKNIYNKWSSIDIPFYVGLVKKIFKASNNDYWLCTNSGVLISRDYEDGSNFELVTAPGGYSDVSDIVEGNKNEIYISSRSGIYKTLNYGKTWNKMFDIPNGFKQIVRDYTLDKTNVLNGHYHTLDVDIDGNGFLNESIGTGVLHVHVVSNWNIEPTLSHTHVIIPTFYTIDYTGTIYKSVGGDVWTVFGELPDGESSSIFAGYSFIFVSKSDGLYRSLNGSDWNKVLSYRIYSFDWTYDLNGIYMGSDNLLYLTDDGINFEVHYEFSGYPSTTIIKNDESQYFGYAYSNDSHTFHFNDFLLLSDDDTMTATVDFNSWYASEGSWNVLDKYDIYVNNKRIYSTKYNQDKRETYGYYFDIYPSDGYIDFSASSNVVGQLEVNDSIINVSNSSGFNTGDEIVLYYNNTNSYKYHSIVSINDNSFLISPRVTQNINLPIQVYKIPNLNKDSSILINIYNSLLSNIGQLTHEELEDTLSYYSDDRPYKLNDSYLSNLLQLTQAVRYVYPDINSEFINSIFYDFKYSLSQVDPVFPYIGNYIDLIDTEINNNKLYESIFNSNKAKAVNDILVGYGTFDGLIFIATDIGIFYAIIEDNLEANWFYIEDVPYTVYDLMIFGQNNLFAATDNGTYLTHDGINWTLEDTPAIDFASYALAVRWSGQNATTVPSHTARFVSDNTSNTGTISASNGVPYLNLSPNQNIKITNADDKNGNYIINSIGNSGSGYGSKLIVEPAFNGIDEIKSGVIITMGAWWQQWNGSVNTANSALTNTVLVGGQNRVAYNDGGDNWTWYGAKFDISGFTTKKFLIASNGLVLSSCIGNGISNTNNYLLQSTDIGRYWTKLKLFPTITGFINSHEISDANNTTLDVTYTYPSNYVCANNILDQYNISIFNGNILIYNGQVIGNINQDPKNYITVYDNILNSLLLPDIKYTFIVYPVKINDIAETSGSTLLFGTDKGIYYDVDSIVNSDVPTGSILSAGINGTINDIDIYGIIKSITFDSNTGHSILLLNTEQIVRYEEVIGNKLYILDSNPIENYTILSNNSFALEDEFKVEIDGVISAIYNNKRIRIVPSKSRIYVDFDLPVNDNEYNNGKIIVASNEYNNIGNVYNIVKNTSSYIDIDLALVPHSTFTPQNTIMDEAGNYTVPNDSNKSLDVNQKVRLISSDNKLPIWVSMTRSIKPNSLAGLNIKLNDVLTDSTGNVSAVSNYIYSNLKNNIVINVDVTNPLIILAYDSGKGFTIDGKLYESLPGFSHKKTSVNIDHFHMANTVGNVVGGIIDSFNSHDSSFVTFTVADTYNFNIPLVQLQGDLFENAEIVFTNQKNYNIRFISEVISHTANTVTVRLKNNNYWDFSGSNNLKVSEDWFWEIDGTDYGYTSGTYYDDFIILGKKITADVNINTDLVDVTDISGFIVGQKVRLQDDTMSYEENTISNIISATRIQLSNNVTRTFFKTKNPEIKVLSDVFSNTHIHQIRNNEVMVVNVPDYVLRGYLPDHSHKVLSYLTDVSSLLIRGNEIISMGSDSLLYHSNNNGVTWTELVDLNNYIEGGDEILGVSSGTLDSNNKIIAGSTDGFLFVESDGQNSIIKLQKPI